MQGEHTSGQLERNRVASAEHSDSGDRSMILVSLASNSLSAWQWRSGDRSLTLVSEMVSDSRLFCGRCGKSAERQECERNK